MHRDGVAMKQAVPPVDLQIDSPTGALTTRKPSELVKKGSVRITSAKVAGPEDRESLITTSKQDIQSLKVLGEGAFGIVDLVLVNVADGQHSLLCVRKKLLKQSDLNNCDPAVEVDVMASCSDAPFVVQMWSHVVGLYDYTILQEYCPYGNLEKLLQIVSHNRSKSGNSCMDWLSFSIFKQPRKAGFSEAEARFFIASVLLGLEAMHAKGILHRDIKPSNILIAQNCYAKVADLGLAKLLGEDQKAYTHAGTPCYMAPEVAHGSKGGYSYTADVWSVGVMLWELVDGELPKWAAMSWYWTSLHFPDKFSQELRALLTGMLEKNPKDRLKLSQVLSHVWFNGFDWEAMRKMTMEAPSMVEYDEVHIHNTLAPPTDVLSINTDLKQSSFRVSSVGQGSGGSGRRGHMAGRRNSLLIISNGDRNNSIRIMDAANIDPALLQQIGAVDAGSPSASHLRRRNTANLQDAGSGGQQGAAEALQCGQPSSGLRGSSNSGAAGRTRRRSNLGPTASPRSASNADPVDAHQASCKAPCAGEAPPSRRRSNLGPTTSFPTSGDTATMSGTSQAPTAPTHARGRSNLGPTADPAGGGNGIPWGASDEVLLLTSAKDAPAAPLSAIWRAATGNSHNSEPATATVAGGKVQQGVVVDLMDDADMRRCKSTPHFLPSPPGTMNPALMQQAYASHDGAASSHYTTATATATATAVVASVEEVETAGTSSAHGVSMLASCWSSSNGLLNAHPPLAAKPSSTARRTSGLMHTGNSLGPVSQDALYCSNCDTITSDDTAPSCSTGAFDTPHTSSPKTQQQQRSHNNTGSASLFAPQLRDTSSAVLADLDQLENLLDSLGDLAPAPPTAPPPRSPANSSRRKVHVHDV